MGWDNQAAGEEQGEPSQRTPFYTVLILNHPSVMPIQSTLVYTQTI